MASDGVGHSDWSDTVLACPECDVAGLSLVTTREFRDVEEGDYLCSKCGARTDEPVERERRSSPGFTDGTMAATLDEMDADDLGGAP